MNIEEKILNKEEAAKFIGISSRTIERWIKEKVISHIRIGKKVLFKKSQLIEDLDDFKIEKEDKGAHAGES